MELLNEGKLKAAEILIRHGSSLELLGISKKTALQSAKDRND